MPIPYFCYDGDGLNGIPPHRPSRDDLGSDALEDFPGEPVDPRFGISALAENQRNMVGHGLAKVTRSLLVTVRFSGGAPFVHAATAARTTPIAVTPTDNGTGDTTLTWPANSIAPLLVDPAASINGSSPGMVAVETVANGVRIRTLGSNGSAADLPFTVEI